MIQFPKPYRVLRPAAGAFVQGVWQPAAEPAAEPAAVTVALNVQPAGSSDYEQVRAMPGGQHMTQLLVAYGNDGDLTPQGTGKGDIVLIGGERFRVIGKMVRNSLGSPDVAHTRYLLSREIPRAPGEA